jgi:hypothetical protein
MRSGRKRLLIVTWAAMLLAPLAWAFSLNVMFPLTYAVCKAGDRSPILWVSGACAALAVAGGVLAFHALGRETASAGSHFLLRVALGITPIFVLVIIMMTVPVALLDSCPR